MHVVSWSHDAFIPATELRSVEQGQLRQLRRNAVNHSRSLDVVQQSEVGVSTRVNSKNCARE